MSISTQSNRIIFNFPNNLRQLLFRTTLCYLLRQVVPKWIIHKFQVIVNSMHKYLISNLLIILIYLLLQKPTTTLVTCEYC